MTSEFPTTISGRRALRLLVVALLAVTLSVAALALRRSPAEPDRVIGYHETLAAVDTRLQLLTERAEAMPNAWTAYEWAAGAALERARLSGDFADYLRAEALLARASEIAEAVGPALSRARLNYTLHRFDAALADLDLAAGRLLLPDSTAREIAGIRADIAFHQGRYRAALAGYQGNLERVREPTDLYRLAYYYWQTGDYAQAEPLLEAAALGSGDLDGRLTAFWHLQRGLMDLDRGRHDQAFAHYLDADAAFPGWWLVREHLAEIHLLEGRLDEAEAIYLTAIEETGNPEFMEAMAAVAAERGLEAEESAWLERARAGYDLQLAQLPEAALGHALGHYLLHEPDDATVLALAARNHALRPGGEATLLLAQAQLRAGRIDEAARLTDALLAGPWRSADLHATAATLERARGNDSAAARHLEQLREIDPTFPPYRLGKFEIGR